MVQVVFRGQEFLCIHQMHKPMIGLLVFLPQLPLQRQLRWFENEKRRKKKPISEWRREAFVSAGETRSMHV